MKNIEIYTKAFFCFLLVLTHYTKAQQVFISQDFENPATMDWSLNEIVPFLGTVSSDLTLLLLMMFMKVVMFL